MIKRSLNKIDATIFKKIPSSVQWSFLIKLIVLPLNGYESLVKRISLSRYLWLAGQCVVIPLWQKDETYILGLTVLTISQFVEEIIWDDLRMDWDGALLFWHWRSLDDTLWEVECCFPDRSLCSKLFRHIVEVQLATSYERNKQKTEQFQNWLITKALIRDVSKIFVFNTK